MPEVEFEGGRGIKRFNSTSTETLIYTGPQVQKEDKVTLQVIRSKFSKGQPISMVTAYDYSSAFHVDTAGIDMVLVGDSVGMVVHGHDTTLPVTLEDMLLYCKAVARGTRRAYKIGDLPFGSYEATVEDAIRSAVRLVKEGNMDCVKLEGGLPSRVRAVKAIIESGIGVIGHVGLTPQMIGIMGGFRPQGKEANNAVEVLEHAKALEQAGCFAIVAECIPSSVGAAIQKSLNIPVIGIGAGPACAGQVLVYHDLLGFTSHPHHMKVTPKFCKRYANVGDVIQKGLEKFKEDIDQRQFPGIEYSPYKIKEEELDKFCKILESRGYDDASRAAHLEFKKLKINL